MEIFINVADSNSFLEKLRFFLEKSINNFQFKYINNTICIFCRYFYIDILSNKDTDLDCIIEEFKVNINLELWINVYNETYYEGLQEIVKILNWIIKNIETDIVLLDEQSHLILSLTQKQIYFDKNYLNFPFEDLDVS